jgi:hypothetical protein
MRTRFIPFPPFYGPTASRNFGSSRPVFQSGDVTDSTDSFPPATPKTLAGLFWVVKSCPDLGVFSEQKKHSRRVKTSVDSGFVPQKSMQIPPRNPEGKHGQNSAHFFSRPKPCQMWFISGHFLENKLNLAGIPKLRCLQSLPGGTVMVSGGGLFVYTE